MSAKCSRCGKVLRDPYSIAVGMGPECRGSYIKKGGKLPKPIWRVHAGRVEMVGMTPAEPMTTHLEDDDDDDDDVVRQQPETDE